jgi:hypothetical protein
MNMNNERLERNSALWTGTILIVLAFLSFMLFFVSLPGKQALPWVNLLLSVLAVVLFAIGLRRAISQPERYRGKIAGWVLTVVSSLFLLFSIAVSYGSRHLPATNTSPQMGQKAPEFTLKDTNGQTASLTGLLAQPLDATSKPPKALLLVFYRGYW